MALQLRWCCIMVSGIKGVGRGRTGHDSRSLSLAASAPDKTPVSAATTGGYRHVVDIKQHVRDSRKGK